MQGLVQTEAARRGRADGLPHFLVGLLAAETGTERFMCGKKQLWLHNGYNKLPETFSMESLNHRSVEPLNSMLHGRVIESFMHGWSFSRACHFRALERITALQ